jgi:hypothetical protein
MSAELLQEERYAGAGTLLLQVSKPIYGSGSTTALTLPACNQPVNPIEVEIWKRRQEWFGRDEANSGRHLSQVIDAPYETGRFD